jgi:regulator of protease activity HflC (stomatin/prohibitin superfamily)
MMKFPYPENSDDWQTAYTSDQAFHDSDKYGNLLLLPAVSWCFFIIVIYVCVFTIELLLPIETYSLITLGFILSFILLFSFALVAVVRKSSDYFAKSFFVQFYSPPEGIDPSEIIDNRLFGRSKLPPPLNMLSKFKNIIVKDGEILNKDKWPAWSACNLGGPIKLMVFDGCALYLERGNRFSRVVGPGDKIPFLEWYETIKYVVDLRPKVKTDSFDVWTKDGIKIKFTVQIECRIGDPSKHDPASSLIYPYDPLAVKKAIERYALRWPNRIDGEPSEFTWIDAAWGQVTGIIPSYVGSRMLDDLFIADRQGGQILSPDAMKEIFEKLDKATNGFGVFITDFQIAKIEIPKEVDERQKHHWKAERQSIATILEGKAKALSIRTQEKARADAQRDLIMAIADGLEKNIDRDAAEGDKERFIEPLLLSFSGILDESLSDPLARAYLAKDTLEVLEKLQNMLEKPSP